MKKFKILSANSIKIIALISMIIDHVGYVIFPQVKLLHIIGRLAFPLFAYFIAEGCRYTKNKLKHFVLILSLGVLFQSVYFLYLDRNDIFNIFITFSLSILLIYALEEAKCNYFESKKLFVFSTALFLFLLAFVFVVCKKINIDYGFFGVILPLFVSWTYTPATRYAKKLKKIDNNNLRLISFTLGVILLALSKPPALQLIFGLGAVPIIFLYNGKKGKLNLKYMFYIAYPAHMVIIYFLSKFI